MRPGILSLRIVFALALLAVPVAALAQAAFPAIAAATPTAVDFSAEALKLVGIVATTIISWATIEVRKVVKDKAAQDTVIAALKHGGAYVVNRTAGALKDRPLTVDLASPMAADLVRYVKSTVPGALKRLGVTDVGLAKLAIAHLPGVDGKLDDNEVNVIAAAATGKPPVAGTLAADAGAIAEQLGPAIIAGLGPAIAAMAEAAVAAKFKAAQAPVAPVAQTVQQQAPAG